MLRFASPWLLLALVAVPLLVWLEVRHAGRRRPAVTFPDLATVASVGGRTAAWKRIARIAARAAVLTLLIVALARPQSGSGSESVLTEGIDIMLVLDVSGSMRTEDWQPVNRLAVAKDVVANFIRGRASDRIGMVVFAANAFTQCPLTLDYNVLEELLASVRVGMIDENSTAIGMAIATAANRLRESDAKSRIIVLLTDGRNNAGEVDPITAARAAGALGLKIYAIAAGTPEGGPLPIEDPMWGRRYVNAPTEIDEDTLREVAAATGGQYYRAKTEGMLAEIYRRIGELEKTKIEVKHFTTYTERAPRLVIAGLVLLLALLAAEATVLRGMP
jgi:Ca-activated chloride channel family protein